MAANDKDEKSPATTSLAYDRMAPRWQVMETVLGGTEAMRAAGEAFLPKYEEETDQGYDCRRNGAVLLNMVEQTLATLSGKPFSEEVKLNDDVPEALKAEILEDVDLQGNNLNVFAKAWFTEGMAKAFAHVLVEMPRTETPAEGQPPRTLEDDRREKVRPYWILIKPEAVLFAQAEMRDGKETLLHVRILECYTERKGFREIVKKQIRILEPGRVEIWRPIEKKGGNDKEEWAKHDEYQTGLDYIPLVTFYADREDFMVGKPPLLDLAWLNVAHWQSTSDQRHILTVSRFPLLACSGASKEDSDPVIIGPNKILYNPDPQGKFYYVEHTGAAIAAGRTDLQDLEEQMSGYGAEFLKKKPGTQTATARALDSAEQTSDLQAIAGLFEDAVAQALDMTVDWMNAGDTGGTIEVVKDYAIEELDPTGLQALQTAREKRDISREVYVESLRLMGILPEDYDAEADKALILDETSELIAAAGLDLDPSGQPKPPAPAPGGTPAPSPSPSPGKKPAPRKPVKKAKKGGAE